MLLLFTAATLLIADPANPPAQPAPAAGQKKICKTFEVTGTRMGKDRVCKTADEWQAEEAVRNHEVEEAQRVAASQR
ncbi:hypothetical protein M8312_02545 [Sphingomonas sp. KRR8]|uniref:hypothetical protein n=1 Tax=Sphingomonas sp. KRR8 TaxID=2942996 RepID=UPI0020221698|nr:hypothetical protein [Sphingomonas sp. KRR8]URD61412.1 hypothetical protein M8312_02545 [Sphingomonas sp. KRR8]